MNKQRGSKKDFKWFTKSALINFKKFTGSKGKPDKKQVGPVIDHLIIVTGRYIMASNLKMA